MKKAVIFVSIILIVVLIYQFIIVLFSNSHEITYKISKDDYEFVIDEVYEKNSKLNGYLLNIRSADDRKFVYYIDNYYNKQKKIIEDIEVYEKDKYLCIYPISIKKNNEFEILCNDGDTLYSSYYVNKKIDINKFVKKRKREYEYKNDTKEKYVNDTITFYQNNFYDNEYLELYRYKYLDVFNKKELKTYKFSDKDIYINNLGNYINNYFVVPKYNEKNKITSFHVINILNGKTKDIDFKETLSQKIYRIGIIGNTLYIFDLDNKKEYEINIEKGTYEIIGTVEDGFKIYKDEEWKTISITEFINNKITFDIQADIDLDYEYDKIYQTDKAYYIINDNKLYKIYKNNKAIKILLLELNNYTNIQITNDRVYYISGVYLYRYDENGLKKLVENNEFKYNNTNIYYMYNNK